MKFKYLVASVFALGVLSSDVRVFPGETYRALAPVSSVPERREESDYQKAILNREDQYFFDEEERDGG